MKSDIWGFSEICPENSSFSKIGPEYRVRYMKPNTHFWSYLAHFFLERELFQTKVVEKIEIHTKCSITFFFGNRAIYEIMWKNIVERDRPQTTTWGMPIACWVPKSTDINNQVV